MDLILRVFPNSTRRNEWNEQGVLRYGTSATPQLNVGLSRSELDKFSGSTDAGWALLPVLCALSRPRVANLRLNQQPVKAFLLILPTLRLSAYAALVLCQKEVADVLHRAGMTH